VGVWLFKLDVTWGVIIGAGLFVLIMISTAVQTLTKRARAA
jgi:hypothetical protein